MKQHPALGRHGRFVDRPIGVACVDDPVVRHVVFFFFNDTATTEIYTLSLHDALPIWPRRSPATPRVATCSCAPWPMARSRPACCWTRSEEHTSELQSLAYLVCRLLLEKKKSAPVALSAVLDDFNNGLAGT